MTTLIALENSSLADTVTMTQTGTAASGNGSVSLNAQVGETFTMEQCLYAIMLGSANDISTQIAEQVGGSVENFVTMMNQKAKDLGCTNTNFTNPTGLPDEKQTSTAYDLADYASRSEKRKFSDDRLSDDLHHTGYQPHLG